MSNSSPIHDFIERAKTNGASDQAIVGILTARGWSEKEVYDALAPWYERLTGAEIPRGGSAGTPAKDAFFYLVLFSTLATWTIGVGSLAFTLIDQWLPDAAFSQTYNQSYEVYSVASSLASILVAFPIFLLVSRSVVRATKEHPGKLDSPVRKWLTYMALVIAAGVFIGDLVTVVTYFLRGEATWRFFSKAIVVLVLSGGVFFHYFGGLRKTEQVEGNGSADRNSWMAGLSSIFVAIMLILGFSNIGTPGTQRRLRTDQRRVEDLYRLSEAIGNHWRSRGGRLPAHLDELPAVPSADPATRTPYAYKPGNGSQYDLCATFSLPSRRRRETVNPPRWEHPAGYYCFALDASQSSQNPNSYFPD